jgi:hypothetical protein
MRFFKVCTDNKIPVVDILQRAKNEMLNLRGYFLNDSLCKALLEVCKVHPSFVNSLILENNGLKDKAMAILLEGMNS